MQYSPSQFLSQLHLSREWGIRKEEGERGKGEKGKRGKGERKKEKKEERKRKKNRIHHKFHERS